MGMNIQPSSLHEQMYAQNKIQSKAFSLCFARSDTVDKDGSIAGALTMGGTDTKLHDEPMVYANGFKAKGTMHGVTIKAVYLMEAGAYGAGDATSKNVHALPGLDVKKLNAGSVIVDSGTTDTYMNQIMGPAFKNAWKKMVGVSYSTSKMKMTDKQVDTIPTILIQLEGIKDNVYDKNNPMPGLAGKVDSKNPNDILIAMPPAHYVEYDPNKEVYMGRFSVNERYGSVLGANFMRGKVFLSWMLLFLYPLTHVHLCRT